MTSKSDRSSLSYKFFYFNAEEPKTWVCRRKNVSCTIWEGSEVFFPLKTLKKFLMLIAEVPDALIANFVIFNWRHSCLKYVDKISEFFFIKKEFFWEKVYISIYPKSEKKINFLKINRILEIRVFLRKTLLFYLYKKWEKFTFFLN